MLNSHKPHLPMCSREHTRRFGHCDFFLSQWHVCYGFFPVKVGFLNIIFASYVGKLNLQFEIM